MTDIYQRGYCKQPTSDALEPGADHNSSANCLLWVRKEPLCLLCPLQAGLGSARQIGWLPRQKIVLRSSSGDYFHVWPSVISIPHALVCELSIFPDKLISFTVILILIQQLCGI